MFITMLMSGWIISQMDDVNINDDNMPHVMSLVCSFIYLFLEKMF